jgi:membrane associated rhomboid family serine protease
MSHAAASETHYCYRHPDRETLLSCSVCERPICTACMSPAPVGIRCPECAGKTRSGTGNVQRGRSLRGLTALNRRNPVTITLIAINALILFVELAQGVGVWGGGTSSIVTKGGLYGPAVANGETWRLVTSGFIHAGIVHVAVNMWVLWILGTVFESYVGSRRMILVYSVSLLWAAAGALVLSPGALTVGASGAIFGLMGAMVVMFRQQGIAIMRSGLGVWILINLGITLTIPGVSIGGHVGGLIGGALCGFVLSGYGRGHIAYGRMSSPVAAGILVLVVVAIGVSLMAAHGTF